MDDAFVLLAAWRRTNPDLPVSERLGLSYAEAAVSITITSVTNFISFMIGTITPFPSVSQTAADQGCDNYHECISLISRRRRRKNEENDDLMPRAILFSKILIIMITIIAC